MLALLVSLQRLMVPIKSFGDVSVSPLFLKVSLCDLKFSNLLTQVPLAHCIILNISPSKKVPKQL